jgi:hypothetical protein
VCCDISERGRASFLAMVSHAAEDEGATEGLLDLVEAVAKGPRVSDEGLLVQASSETRDLTTTKSLEAMARVLALRIGELVLVGDTKVTRVALVLHCEPLASADSDEAQP